MLLNTEGTVILSSQNVNFFRCEFIKPYGRRGMGERSVTSIVQNSVSTAHRLAHRLVNIASITKIYLHMLLREIVVYCHNYPGDMNRLRMAGKMQRFLVFSAKWRW